MVVVNRIAGFADEMAGWRRHLHMHPELCLDCHETASFVVSKLREFGVDHIETGIAKSGVVGVIDCGDGPVTGLRADMDALPMQEETGAEWASKVDGRMHACGHDGHTAMLLGATKYLCENRGFRGKVVVIFQPAEETVGGARLMVEEGILERYEVEEVYALHTDPFGELGEFRTRSGPLLAAVDDYEIKVNGTGGHAAYPQECNDPMPAALSLAQTLLTLPRAVDPLSSLVVGVTQVHGGSATNIVPEQVVVGGTVRALTPEIRDFAERRIREISEGLAVAHGLQIVVDYQRNYPPTINHAPQTRFAVDVAREVSGQVIDDLPPNMGSEDFSFMLEARPGSFLSLGQGIGPSVHHPKFDFNDDAAVYGASFFARLIERRHGKVA